jgi:demethylmenaquinone methyltransferase/2-methoxy-6-polyprenyl-1,4-benzoquinol methylase
LLPAGVLTVFFSAFRHIRPISNQTKPFICAFHISRYELPVRKNEMFWKGTKWPGEKARKEPAPEDPKQSDNAWFGYRRIPADEKGQWVRNQFDKVARRYDFMNTFLSLGIHHGWKRKAVKTSRLMSGEWVIDLCGGTGDLSILAAKAIGTSGRLVLYDINRSMMEIGRTKVLKSPFGHNVWYVQGDAERLSFPDELFEAALVGFGIRNLTNIEDGLKEAHRVLKPGGRFICLEFSKPTATLFRWLYDFYSLSLIPLLGWFIVGSKRAYTYLPESIRTFPLPDELSSMLMAAGFSEVTYRRLTNGIAVVHLAKKK